MARLRILAVTALAFFVVACGSTEPKLDPTVTGTFQGTFLTTETMRLTLNQTEDGSVSGTGTVTGSLTNALTVVAGQHVFPNLSLTVRPTGFEDFNITGTVSTNGNTIVATLNGSGFTGDPITFTRQ